MKIRKNIYLIMLVLGLMLINHSAVAQCAMCKSNLEKARENGGTPVGNTLNTGILYLLVLPYAIAGVFGAIYYRKYKLVKKSLGEK